MFTGLFDSGQLAAWGTFGKIVGIFIPVAIAVFMLVKNKIIGVAFFGPEDRGFLEVWSKPKEYIEGPCAKPFIYGPHSYRKATVNVVTNTDIEMKLSFRGRAHVLTFSMTQQIIDVPGHVYVAIYKYSDMSREDVRNEERINYVIMRVKQALSEIAEEGKVDICKGSLPLKLINDRLGIDLMIEAGTTVSYFTSTCVPIEISVRDKDRDERKARRKRKRQVVSVLVDQSSDGPAQQVGADVIKINR